MFVTPQVYLVCMDERIDRDALRQVIIERLDLFATDYRETPKDDPELRATHIGEIRGVLSIARQMFDDESYRAMVAYSDQIREPVLEALTPEQVIRGESEDEDD